VLIKNV